MTKEEAISQIRAGKLAIENDGTVKDLRKVLAQAWPNDKYSYSTQGTYKYYHQCPDNDLHWEFDDETTLATIKQGWEPQMTEGCWIQYAEEPIMKTTAELLELYKESLTTISKKE